MVENGAKKGKNGMFWVFGWGNVGIGMRCAFFGGIVAQMQNYNSTRAFLEVHLTGQVLWPSYGRSESNPITVGILGGLLLKNKMSSKNLTGLLLIADISASQNS